MATEIPPHNLRSATPVADRRTERLAGGTDPAHPGPDFPTGGIIRGRPESTATALAAARSRSRARAHQRPGQANQIIDEVPIDDAQQPPRRSPSWSRTSASRISNVRDESSARNNEPVRIVIDLKRDADANLVLNQFYQFVAGEDRQHHPAAARDGGAAS
jgi:DNA gyrase subunit A